MTTKSLFIGAHFWIAPLGAAFTSPSGGNITQNGTWPDVGEANWATWALGICESFDIDPKAATSEMILAPSPGAVQVIDEISPYATPEISFTLLQVDSLAFQLALNTQQLWATATTQFNPNGGGGPGLRGIIKAQKYDQQNNLILNYQSWAYIKLKSALKGAPKTMTKPEYTATLLYSPNNTGAIPA
jgi:hypothetical protein